MSDGDDKLSREGKIAAFLVGLLIFSAVGGVIAENFTGGFNQYGTPGKFNASSGPLVTLGQNYNLEGGQPATSASINLSKEDLAWLNVSSTGAGPAVTVDTINGTANGSGWTNVSSISGTGTHNITLQPRRKNFTRVGGSITAFKFKDPKVEDGKLDAIYSGSGTLVFETNATDGTQYGLVDMDTGEGLDVGTADSNGVVAFTDVPSGTTREVRIQQLGTLTIREENPAHGKITSATARVKFFETGDDDDPTLANRTTNNGEVDLTGLPVDEQFVVQVKAPGYYNRTILIDDLGTQETVFLLDKNKTANVVTFDISDPTGQFTGENTEIIIQRAINVSIYNGEGFVWKNIEGDKIGATGEITATLEHEERYRIKISNADETRVLGGYTPKENGTEILRPSLPGVNITDEEGYAWNGTVNNTAADKIIFEFNDPDDNTTNLRLRIYEQNNESNEIYDQTHPGPHGYLKVTQLLTNKQANETWVLDWNATRGGDTIGGERVIGRKVIEQIPELDQVWQEAIAVLAVILIGGLFSVRNVGAGAVTTAFVGGGFWMAGWLPDAAGGAIMLALVVAVLWKVRQEGIV